MNWPRKMGLGMLRVERFMIFYTIAFYCISALLVLYKGVDIQLSTFVALLVAPSIFGAIGVFYRFVRKDDRISSLVFVLAIFGFFTLIMATYSQLILPFPDGAIDATLVAIDAMLGFSWPGAMEFSAQFANATAVMGHVYDHALAWILVTFAILAIKRGPEPLHQFTLAMMFTVTACILIWSALPGAGASAYWQLPDHIENAINPRVGTKYGQDLLALYATGFPSLDSLSMKGIIGFPSFHTVMFVLPAWYLFPVNYVRWFAVAFAAIGVPSVLIHGGHNLVDMLAGLAIAVAGIYAARHFHGVLQAPAQTKYKQGRQTAHAMSEVD